MKKVSAAEQIALAKEFRLAEKPTELVKKSDDRFLDEYVSYARQNFCGGMFYLKREDEILMTNLLTDEKKQSVGRKSYEIFNICIDKRSACEKNTGIVRAAWHHLRGDEGQRFQKINFVNEELKLKFFLAKGPDVPTYVEYGAA